MTSKQVKEAQLQTIFRMLLQSKTWEQISRELDIGMRTVARYSIELDKRYGQAQRQKTDDTLFLECSLFKNRMLNLYKIAEEKAADPKASGSEAAKCIEVAANIAIDVLKMESEGIKIVKELGGYYGKTNRLLNSIKSKYEREEAERDNNIIQQSSDSSFPATDNPNRKF